ncbi:MAG: hypothetical protein KF784_02800 [Fimbriimonadaceae bacterium]|nr:hypothetical protein [Fimbriimonadaceae bacterium]
MKSTARLLFVGATITASSLGLAIDHNNIDGGRPLRFDDAYSIAFGERALELGFSMDVWRRNAPLYGFKSELKYGHAKNKDIGIAFEPTYDSGMKRFDTNDIELTYFHGVRREIDNQPALGYRLDVGIPTGRDAQGVEVRFRGIMTKALHQYDKVHLNVDVAYASQPHDGERDVTLGAILGYSAPVGYPTRFDQTLVAEFAVQQSAMRSQGWTGTAGIGLRKQVGVRSVIDFGLEADVFATRGAPRTDYRFVVGYSISF